MVEKLEEVWRSYFEALQQTLGEKKSHTDLICESYSLTTPLKHLFDAKESKKCLSKDNIYIIRLP